VFGKFFKEDVRFLLRVNLLWQVMFFLLDNKEKRGIHANNASFLMPDFLLK